MCSSSCCHMMQVDVFACGIIIYEAWLLQDWFCEMDMAKVLQRTPKEKRKTIVDKLEDEVDMPTRLKDMLM